MTKQHIKYGLRYILAGIFLITAVSKFIDPYPFGDFLNSLRILQGKFIIPAVYVLSIAELVLSLLFLFNYASKAIAFLFLGVISLATIYSTVIHLSGMSCGCFGGFLDREPGIVYYLSNGLILIGLTAYLWLLFKTEA